MEATKTSARSPAAELSDERVAEIRTNYEQRAREAEDTYQRRADNMKKQLSTKLAEGKDNLRHQLNAEHAEAIERLKLEYNAEAERLRQEHQAEIERLKQEHQVEVERIFKERPTYTQGRATQTQATEGSTRTIDPAPTAAEPPTPVKTEVASVPSFTDLTDSQAKELVDKNATIKAIVRNNITKRVAIESAKIKEEQEAITLSRLEEAKKALEKQKEQAVIMEGKRFNVKLSMAEGKARNAIAKLEVIEKAAGETPERTVAEVWAIAKNAKVPSLQQAQSPQVKPAGQVVQQAATPKQQATQPRSKGNLLLRHRKKSLQCRLLSMQVQHRVPDHRKQKLRCRLR